MTKGRGVEGTLRSIYPLQRWFMSARVVHLLRSVLLLSSTPIRVSSSLLFPSPDPSSTTKDWGVFTVAYPVPHPTSLTVSSTLPRPVGEVGLPSGSLGHCHDRV